MKKLISMFVAIIILISTSTISNASTRIEASLNSTSQKLYQGDTIVFTLKLDTFQEIKYGINAYQGTFVYDKAIFEEVKETDFKTMNGWEGLQYNPNTSEFVLYKKAGTILEENVLEVSLKVREGVKATKTEVKMEYMVTSEGKKDIYVVNAEKAKLNIDILEEQQKPDDKPTGEPDIKPGDTPTGKPDNKPGDTPTGKPDNKPEDKPSTQKPGEISYSKSTIKKPSSEINLEEQEQLYKGKLPRTGRNYTMLFLLLIAEVLLAIRAVYFGKKWMTSEKTKISVVATLAIVLSMQFIGTVYGAVTTFAQKGELNGDGAVNYADVNLLVSHLVHLKPLGEDKTIEEVKTLLENADMNSDGKITITDLSILIQKIENKLNYEVTIRELLVNNYYPAKNEEIVISFDADVNYDAIIQAITINGKEYEIKRNEANNNLYEIKINVGNTSGVTEYKLEKAKLDNGKEVKLKETIKIDILKQQPEIANWRVEEDIEKTELNLSYDVVDPDKSFIIGNYRIIEKKQENENATQETTDYIQEGEIVSGNNKINVKVEEGKEYQILLSMQYNLDTDTLEVEGDNQGSVTHQEDLSFIVNYDFKVSNFETYRYQGETAEKTEEFKIGEVIALKFSSTNATTCTPKEAIINGKTYELTKENDTYKALVDGLSSTGNHTIKLEKVILTNGKTFEVNQEIPVKVIKNAPMVSRFRANESPETKQMDIQLYIKDRDHTITDLTVKLYDNHNNEIATKNLTDQLVEDNLTDDSTEEEIKNTYYINSQLDTSKATMASSYRIKVFANYELLENDNQYTHTQEMLLEEKIEATPVVNINKVEASKKYPEKKENITLTYEMETNKKDLEITHILVNNLKCIATKHIDNDENVTYSVTLSAGETAGILNLDTTEFFFEGNVTANASNRVQVDVLKAKPTSEAFKQVDDIQNHKVTLTANIVDPDKAFIKGKADLIRNSDNQIMATKEFDAEHITFAIENVEIDTEYTLVAKMTYDRDTNQLPEETNQNYVEDEEFRRRPIQLIADYELKINDIKTYKGEKQTKYFERGEEVTIAFDSTNKTVFYPVQAVINGKTYSLEKQGTTYKTNVPVVSSFGPKTITIEKVILDNTKEIEITENNQTRVGILKLRPTITGFGYVEDEENQAIKVNFVVNDTEDTITGGTIKITNENGEIVKQEPFNRNLTEISFPKGVCEEYEIEILVDYDLDTNQITTGDNEYVAQKLLAERINISAERLFEVKDILEISLYQEGKASEVTSITESQLKDHLDDYIVKVRTKGMPMFYTTIEDYEITEEGDLNFILAYDHVIQYEEGTKQNKLKVTYSKMENGVAHNKSIEALISEIEKNPAGTFTLTQNYDASYLNVSRNSIIPDTFRGTLNGNGYKIYNVNKPLFETLEGATVKNLTLENVNLVGANSKGAISNVAQNTTINNVHIKGLDMTTGSNESAGMVGDMQPGCTVEESSVTKLHIKLDHIRVAAIAGKFDGSTIKDCYVEGIIESVTSTRDGIGGIAGDGWGTADASITNCIAKIEFVNNTRAKNNGGILGLVRNSKVTLTNNISLCTGTGVNKICGTAMNSASINNYELEESQLISNASGNKVKKIAKANMNQEFFVEEAKFDEEIWNCTDVSYENLPALKKDSHKGDDIVVEESTTNKLYIPEYSRIKKIAGFDNNKLTTYHNLHKLMPYYDAKYLVMDASSIPTNDVLSTKAIEHILPYANGKLITYLTSKDYQKITTIKVVFEDNSVKEYTVNFEKFQQNIAIYKIPELKLNYAYDNYAIKEDGSMINTIEQYIKGLDYTTDLDPLTTAGDSRLYKDHYNQIIKANAKQIAMQLLQNDENSVLTMENKVLNSKIQQDLIDSGKLKEIVYGYTYYDRWYGFEIRGTKVADLMLFEGKMYSDSMTYYNVVKETFVGNLVPGNTDAFYNTCLKKYTGSSSVGYFLDYIIANIGGYENVDDWFTEYFGSRNILAEVAVDDKPEILYRGWYQLKKNARMILPVITLPNDCAYMISGPAHLQFGPSQLYHKDVNTDAGRTAVRNTVNSHVSLVKRHFSTLADSFDYGKWNRYCIMVYDCTKIITSYKTSYFPGTNVPIGTTAVYTQGKVGLQYPFFKNFSEVFGLWQPAGSSAGVGNTAGFLWFQARPGLTNFDTWTHEFEHALYDKIMLYQRGARVQLETLTEGNVQQYANWSENNLIQDVGPYYFNTSFYLNKEGNATQNLTPERINTKEKLENYYKGQQNALDLLDYIEGKAFIKLTPEQQAKIATRMNISAGWSSWGGITAQQATAMKLTSLEALYDNRIVLRPNNAWGASVRGLNVINGLGSNDYGFESVWVNRWFIGHLDGGYADAFSTKRNFFEMLGYAGVDGYVTYGSKASANDLDAIKKITKMVTGTEMDWKQYKMSRYETVEQSIRNNKFIDVDYMIERYTEALINDANKGDRNISQRTNLRKIYYHYLKSATNDFVEDPLGKNIKITYIRTAQELVEKINKEPYGYYVLANDIDFSGMTTNVTQTFMGRLNGNGHKIIGNKIPIFNKIRYGYVGNLTLEDTDIPRDNTTSGALANKIESSTAEKINVTGLKMYFGSKNDLSLIGGAISNVITRDCTVERLVTKISNKEEFVEKINAETGGIFELTKDIDFTGYTTTGNAAIMEIFTGKIEGNGHTISNLNNCSLFANFRGTVQNLNIRNFTNTGTGRGNGDFVTAFAQETFTATFKNMKFENITLSGRNNVAVVTGMDGRDNANSVFENISVKNANVTGTGVYVSTFAGRKYGGKMKDIYVQGTLNVTGTENGGLVGSMQQGGTIENIITDVAITKSSNSYTNLENSVFNASLIGNIYNTPSLKNSVAFGNMTGYNDAQGNRMLPYKCVGAVQSQVIACLTKCYEVTECVGASRVNATTAGHLDTIARNNLNAEFYRGLGFDEKLWDFSKIATKGYPILK